MHRGWLPTWLPGGAGALPAFEGGAVVAAGNGATGENDLPSIGSCFDPPSVVQADDATALMVDRAQVKEYFTGMTERCRARAR
jgi:hypothetical protein